MRGVSRADLVTSVLLDIALLTVSGPWPLGRHCVLVCLTYASWAQNLPTLPTLRFTAGCWAPVLFFSV